MTSISFLGTPQRYGLSERTVATIHEVLSSYPEVKAAILYGSRALGRHRPGSDIDLTLVGPDPCCSCLARIDADLDDLLLPWVIDLSCHSAISNPALLEHIRRAGQVLYQRADVQPS